MEKSSLSTDGKKRIEAELTVCEGKGEALILLLLYYSAGMQNAEETQTAEESQTAEEIQQQMWWEIGCPFHFIIMIFTSKTVKLVNIIQTALDEKNLS